MFFIRAVLFTSLFLLCWWINYTLAWPALTLQGNRQWGILYLFTGSGIAGLFLIAAILVWRSDLGRLVKWNFTTFCLVMMAIFCFQASGTLLGGRLNLFTGLLSSLALPLLFLLVLLFPQNWLTIRHATSSKLMVEIVRYYVGLLIAMSLTFAALDCIHLMGDQPPPIWVGQGYFFFFAIGLLSCFGFALARFRQSNSYRERHQLRLFLYAVGCAVLPLVALTILPRAMGIPYVNGEISSLGSGASAALLCAMMLRSQKMYSERFQQVIRFLIGMLGLLMIAGMAASLLSAEGMILWATLLLALLGPLWWIGSQAYLKRLLGDVLPKYTPQLKDTFDLDEVSAILVDTVKQVCETSHVCLFVLDDSEREQVYRLAPFSEEIEGCEYLLSRLGELPSLVRLVKNATLLPTTHPFFTSGLPHLFFSDLESSTAENLEGVISVRVQGRMIGFLVLGVRRDHGKYTEADLLIIEELLRKFGPSLELARNYSQSYANNILHAKIFQQVHNPFQSADEAIVSYAKSAALLFGAAEVWMREQRESGGSRWKKACHFGVAFDLSVLTEDLFEHLQEADWTPWFFGQEPPPPALLATHHQLPPLAWLPLQTSLRIGILLLPIEVSAVEAMQTFCRQMSVALSTTLYQDQLKLEAQREEDQIRQVISLVEDDLAQLEDAINASKTKQVMPLLADLKQKLS